MPHPHARRGAGTRGFVDRAHTHHHREGHPADKAAKRQKVEDEVRAEMSMALYGWDPKDPERYDIVLNTSRIPEAAAARAMVDALEVATSSAS
ncbi:MAG TPA: cytidylate kinase family protein [Dermatophilaceae bacterium]|nr:cytidylate kinase family protein [Dermatophilaceae bacterium]